MNANALSFLILFLSFCLLGPLPSQADFIEYGDFVGDNVDFLMVTETSDDPLPLYGAPTVDGDGLNFLAAVFGLEASDGGVDFLDGRLSFVVQAHDDVLINSISLTELGDFSDIGDDSTSIVNAVAFVVADGILYEGQFFFENTGTGAGPWGDGFTINFPAVDEIIFVIDNGLFVNSDVDGVAFIDKQGVSITVGTVPEPASAMLLCGLGVGMATVRRRSSV